MTDCPMCGAPTLKQDTRDLPYTYKKQETWIQGVSGEFCSNCDESIIDAGQTDKLLAGMQAFKLEVDNDAVDVPKG